MFSGLRLGIAGGQESAQEMGIRQLEEFATR
jgi:hypothetical protein